MHKSVRMAIFLPILFLQRGVALCLLDPLRGQQMRYINNCIYLLTMGSKPFEYLTFCYFLSTQCSPTRELYGVVTAL